MQTYDSFIDMGWDPKAFLWRLDNYYRVQHRDTGRFAYLGELMRRNPAQMDVARKTLALLIRGGRVRIVQVKSRKLGSSTFFVTLQHDLAAHCPGYEGAILSHTTEGTGILWRMLQGIHERVLSPDAPETEPHRKHMEFKSPIPDHGEAVHGQGSILSCATMRGFAPFAGATLRGAHTSEFGKLRLPKDRATNMLVNLMNAMPQQGPSLFVMESTAQGVGNLFHDTWLSAVRNTLNGRIPAEGEWFPIFSPAHQDPGLRQEIERGYDWMDWPEDDLVRENNLIREFGVPLEYLRWRRGMLSQSGMDIARQNEEFPDRAEDAFMATTKGVVPQMWIDRARAHVRAGEAFTWETEDHHAPFGSDAVHIRGGNEDLEAA